MCSETLKRKRSVRIPVGQYETLKGMGTMMSNVCFNWSQKGTLSEHERELFRELYKAWDGIIRELP